MKATVKTEFAGRPDGAALARTIKVGETITGDLARVAVAEKWAEEIGDKPPATAPNLDDMTVDELKAFAAERQIDLGDATKKADIRAAIELALGQ